MSYRVDDELQAQMEDMAADFRERQARVRDLRRQLSAVTATARSRDGKVSVEVGPQGQLRAVWMDPGTFDGSSPQRLAAAIVQLAGIATADAARKVQQIVAPMLPTGRPAAGGDLISLLMPESPGTLSSERPTDRQR